MSLSLLAGRTVPAPCFIGTVPQYFEDMGHLSLPIKFFINAASMKKSSLHVKNSQHFQVEKIVVGYVYLA